MIRSDVVFCRKGKCVNMVHFYGDQLWAAGTKEQIPDLEGPDMGFLVKVILVGLEMMKY